MRLKRIEILGFKSFMERTVFTFPSRITAIVGPNGCGKSNIVDAVLWAMGEMRPTHLRGRSMEDVIFNGTETLKPLGMAEVSLIFANEGGPSLEGYGEFSEIMVTRRLFRSGESEYLINKVPCRLKDIKDLFLGTGVGVNAYSIIEQGQVEVMLNARPQERRHLIEEAAGVTKYKERKRETLLKMERTRQNLLRVQDVIAEVRRQMNSLRRQAAKARRYRQYQGEIRDLEVGLALAEFGEKERELAEIEGYLRNKKDEEQRGLAQLASLEGELEEIKRTLLDAEQNLSEAQGEIYRIEGRIQREQERANSLERELQGLHSLEIQCREELEGLKLEQDELSQKEQRYRKELVEIEQQLKGTGELLEAEQGRLAEVEAACAVREKDLEGLKEEILQASTQLTRLHNLIEDGERREREFSQKRERLERDLEVLQKEQEELQQQISRAEEAANKLAERKEALDVDIHRTEEEIQRLQGDIYQKEAHLKELEGELHRLRPYLSSLVDMQRRFEGYAEGVKAIMASERVSFKEGVIGVLADRVEVDPRYEAALEAALGHRLQFLLVREKKDALRAIKHLKEKGLGRGSFLPLDVIPHSQPSSIQKKGDPRFLGSLLEFIRVKEEYRHLFEFLLNDVWLVRDLAEIVETEQAGRGVFVTLEGDIWDREGVLTGGSWDSSPSGILTRKRQIKEIEDEIFHKEVEGKKLSQGLEKLKREALVAKGELEALREEGYKLEREELGLKANLEATKGNLIALKRKAEVLRFELDQIDLEAAQLHEQMEEVAAQMADYRKVKEKGEEDIEGLRKVLAGLWQQRDRLREGVTGLRVQMASLQEREKGLLDSLEELEKARNSLCAQKERKEGQLKQLQAQIQEIIRAQEVARESLGGLIAARQNKDKLLEGKGEEVKGLRAQISELEAIIKGLRVQLKEIQDSISQQGLRLSQIEMDMGHLADRIQERYGISLSSLMEKRDYSFNLRREEANKRLSELKLKVEGLGEVNPGAVEEYEDLRKRYEFLQAQKDDLQKSLATLSKTIAEINRTSAQRFRETFAKANKEFQGLVPRLFGGGQGELVLDNSSAEPGVDIYIQPAGKRLKSVDLLSGGEKALTAIAFIFSLFLLRPTPFCLLDEIDSPLDDANIDRFAALLSEMSQQSQFILITHNKGTMKIADALYGITMETPGVSKVVSVRLN
ncbi:MAG: chromosome segregation protein SMC [Deltaproteobacteria bacterium]|nr:MAG: chromosome segregation protein SMC [Deltaproteobacteria bacterium]